MLLNSASSAIWYLLLFVYSVAISMFTARLAHQIAAWLILERSVYNLWYWPSYLTFGVAAAVVYLPVFQWIRDRLKGTRPRSLFALAGLLLGIVPALFHGSFIESRLPDRTSIETILIYCMYGVSGFVFGHCYVAMCRFEGNGIVSAG